MVKRPAPQAAASDLVVKERVLLFCVASGTDWQRAGVTGETVTALVVNGIGASMQIVAGIIARSRAQASPAF